MRPKTNAFGEESWLTQIRHRYASLARELLDRLMEPRVGFRRDGLAAADRPPDDEGRDQPFEEDEEQRERDHDREPTRERVGLEDVVDDRDDEQEQEREEREQEDDGE